MEDEKKSLSRLFSGKGGGKPPDEITALEVGDDDDGHEEEEPDDVVGGEIESPESKSERLAAADAVRLWVKEERPSNALILQRLEKNLRSRSKLNEWGAFSLDDLLRPPSYDQSRHWTAKLANGFTLTRNLFLFAPVMLTWFAIDRANAAYKIETGKQGVDTFLQVWNKQDLDLSLVARIDGILIAVLIGLTLLAHVFDGKAESAARRRDDDADDRFRNVMVDVGLYLHGFRQITPAALGGGLVDSVNQLVRATESMKAAAEDMRLITREGASTLEKFRDLSAEEFAPASERLATLASTLEAAAGSHKELSELVKILQKHLEDTVGSMKTQLTDLVRDLVSQLERNVNAVAVSTSQVGERIDKMGENLSSSAAATDASVEALHRILDDWFRRWDDRLGVPEAGKRR